MSESEDEPRADLSRALQVRSVGLDDLSAVRYVHESAMRSLASASYGAHEIEAFRSYVYSPRYADRLLADTLLTGWLGGDLIATSGWALPLERGEAARIRAIYVRPLFTGLGIGLRMLEAAEASARKSGFTEFAVRATLNAIGFFEAAGYEVISHGSRTLPGGVAMPVAFMRKSDEDAVAPVHPHGTA
jgi:GNAT superfamily N-acetyltransferase